ncbi:hypothetical protein Tco_0398523 [Tanacetum coccineum]
MLLLYMVFIFLELLDVLISTQYCSREKSLYMLIVTVCTWVQKQDIINTVEALNEEEQFNKFSDDIVFDPLTTTTTAGLTGSLSDLCLIALKRRLTSILIAVADEAASTSMDVRYGRAVTTVTSLDAGQGSGNIDKTPSMLHDSPLPRVHTLRSDEGRMQNNELMDLVTKLSDRVVALETDLQQTKKVYGAAFTKLIKKVKRLEKKDKLNKSRRKLRLVLSDEEGYSFDKIKSLFEATMKRVNTFTPMESDVDKTVSKIAAGSTKRAAEEELGQQSFKKQKSDELSQEEL